MDTKEIIDAALALEEEGKRFYEEKARNTDNPVVKRVFQSLAEDEERHALWIRKELPPPSTAGEAKKPAIQRFKQIFTEASEEWKREPSGGAEDIEPLRLALKIEEKSQASFAKWKAETEDKEMRSLLEKLEEAERFHGKLIENTILFLENPDRHFQMEEGWMLDGG